jgi:hypothetical protein
MATSAEYSEPSDVLLSSVGGTHKEPPPSKTPMRGIEGGSASTPPSGESGQLSGGARADLDVEAQGGLRTTNGIWKRTKAYCSPVDPESVDGGLMIAVVFLALGFLIGCVYFGSRSSPSRVRDSVTESLNNCVSGYSSQLGGDWRCSGNLSDRRSMWAC